MKVLNFGSCNIDYVYQMEHFIRPGETAPCTALSAGCGGKGLNQSIALAKAGTEVYHAGLYGAEGKFLLDKMQEAGVDTSLMRLGEGANGHAIIQVERSGQNCIILYGGTNRQITQDYADEVLSHFAAGDVLVLQNEINNMPYIMKKAHERGLRIAFNAAPYGQEVLSYPLETVTWLIVNEVEGAGLSGKTDYEEIAEALAEQYPGMNIMLTMGKSGCLYKGSRRDCAPRCVPCGRGRYDGGRRYVHRLLCARHRAEPLHARYASAGDGCKRDCRDQTRRGGRCSGAQRSARLAIAGNDLINGHEGGDRASFCLRQKRKTNFDNAERLALAGQWKA